MGLGLKAFPGAEKVKKVWKNLGGALGAVNG